MDAPPMFVESRIDRGFEFLLMAVWLGLFLYSVQLPASVDPAASQRVEHILAGLAHGGDFTEFFRKIVLLHLAKPGGGLDGFGLGAMQADVLEIAVFHASKCFPCG